MVGGEQRLRFGANGSHPFAFFRRDAGEKMTGEFGNIFPARAQWRHGQKTHMQAVAQVFTETAGLRVIDEGLDSWQR